MYRLSAIIEEVFKTYLPVAEKRKVALNLDFPDPTKRIDSPSKVKVPLETELEAAILRARKEVSLLVRKNYVMIKDDGEVLSSAQLEKITTLENVEAKTRVGFGTEVKIKF